MLYERTETYSKELKNISHRLYSRVLFDSHNKQKIFPCTLLINGLCQENFGCVWRKVWIFNSEEVSA
jgi:hypothetical protein